MFYNMIYGNIKLELEPYDTHQRHLCRFYPNTYAKKLLLNRLGQKDIGAFPREKVNVRPKHKNP